MTQGLVKTQGTHIFFVDNTTDSTGSVTKMACPTGATDGGSEKDQIESTCLDALEAKEFLAGLSNPGTYTIPFNLIPRDGSHHALYELKRTGAVVDWVIALSEGDGVPTLAANGDMEPPTDRTVFQFKGYVSNVTTDMATNDLVRGTLSLQVTGPVTPTWYVPA
jgi:hypothetical protein